MISANEPAGSGGGLTQRENLLRYTGNNLRLGTEKVEFRDNTESNLRALIFNLHLRSPDGSSCMSQVLVITQSSEGHGDLRSHCCSSAWGERPRPSPPSAGGLPCLCAKTPCPFRDSGAGSSPNKFLAPSDSSEGYGFPWSPNPSESQILKSCLQIYSCPYGIYFFWEEHPNHQKHYIYSKGPFRQVTWINPLSKQ